MVDQVVIQNDPEQSLYDTFYKEKHLQSMYNLFIAPRKWSVAEIMINYPKTENA